MSKITASKYYRTLEYKQEQVMIGGGRNIKVGKIEKRDLTLPSQARERKIVKLSKDVHVTILVSPGQLINVKKEAKRQWAKLHPGKEVPWS